MQFDLHKLEVCTTDKIAINPLYPREHKALEVAKELLAYSKSLPVKKNRTEKFGSDE